MSKLAFSLFQVGKALKRGLCVLVFFLPFCTIALGWLGTTIVKMFGETRRKKTIESAHEKSMYSLSVLKGLS